MKKTPNEELLSLMTEKKSQYGNTYFEGVFNTGAKVFLIKDSKRKKEPGRPLWKLTIKLENK